MSGPAPDWSGVRDKIIGLGEQSSRKSYYPELQKRLEDLRASEENLRAAHSAPEIVPLTASRFSAMGRLDPSVTQEHDLDEALRRRRSAG